MFLITQPGERHEDHIPIILLRSKLDVERYFKQEHPHSEEGVQWDESNYPIAGYFADIEIVPGDPEFPGDGIITHELYEIFEISLGRTIPRT